MGYNGGMPSISAGGKGTVRFAGYKGKTSKHRPPKQLRARRTKRQFRPRRFDAEAFAGTL